MQKKVTPISFISRICSGIQSDQESCEQKKKEFNEKWEKTYKPSKKKNPRLP